MAIIKCPECGHQVSDKANTCPSCGISIAGKVKKCPICGEVIFITEESCPICHADLHKAEKNDSAIGGQPTDITVVPDTADMETADTGKKKAGGKKPMKKTYTILAVAFVFAVIVVFVGVYYYQNAQEKNELDAYEYAMSSHEAAILQNYLDIYTNAPQEHRDSIMAHLDLLKKADVDWTNAVMSNSVTELEKYIRLHPNSIHVTEAKLKIDSLDWVLALSDNTVEAYQKYISEHADGLHIDEAKEAFELLEAQKVNDNDSQLISQVFTLYFSSLSNRDESGLTATLDNIMESFLHKQDATKSDVISYMHKLYEPEDITGMTFRLNNDWKIDKVDNGEGLYIYNVTFSVDQKIERTDASKDTFNSYKVEAKVSPEGKISSLNMKRIVQSESAQ